MAYDNPQYNWVGFHDFKKGSPKQPGAGRAALLGWSLNPFLEASFKLFSQGSHHLRARKAVLPIAKGSEKSRSFWV